MQSTLAKLCFKDYPAVRTAQQEPELCWLIEQSGLRTEEMLNSDWTGIGIVYLEVLNG